MPELSGSGDLRYLTYIKSGNLPVGISEADTFDTASHNDTDFNMKFQLALLLVVALLAVQTTTQETPAATDKPPAETQKPPAETQKPPAETQKPAATSPKTPTETVKPGASGAALPSVGLPLNLMMAAAGAYYLVKSSA